MTAASWLQLAAARRPRRRRHPAARRLPRRRVRRRADGRSASGRSVTGSSARSSGSIYRLCGVDPRREQRWSVYALSLLAFSLRVGPRCSTPSSGSRGRCRSTRPSVGAVPAPLAFNTAVSFVTNTNWQNYGGESTMSHLTQMVGLAVQNFVSAAGRPVRASSPSSAASCAGAAPPRSATSGSTSSAAPSGSCCRSRSSSPSSSSARASSRTSTASPTVTTRRGRRPGDPRRAGRQPGGDQGARHERRRLRQRQLGPPVREPERVHQPRCRSSHPAVIPFALTYAFGRMVKDQQAGLGRLRRHVRPLDRLGGALATGMEVARQPRARPRSGVDQAVTADAGAAATWRARRSASARPAAASSRPRRPAPRPVPSTAPHDSMTPARRRGAAGQHDARRGQPGRRRRRASTAC